MLRTSPAFLYSITMTFKPMLAGTPENVSQLRFPVLASQKLDGVRATIQGGRLLARSLKEIPNVNVQRMMAGLPEGLDGELIYGDPCAPDAYRQTVSIVMSDSKPATGIRFHVFDKFGTPGFNVRLADAAKGVDASGNPNVVIVQHVTVTSYAELEILETAWLEEGHEGVMVRSLNGPYKQGRSTEKEGYLLKVKRFKDADATVTGTYEEMRNENTATTNALGHTERSTCQAGKVGKGTLGGLNAKDCTTGVEFDCGGGFTAQMRKELWEGRAGLNGLVFKYKYFPTGSKDKPRFPVFIGWRDRRDM